VATASSAATSNVPACPASNSLLDPLREFGQMLAFGLVRRDLATAGKTDIALSAVLISTLKSQISRIQWSASGESNQ